MSSKSCMVVSFLCQRDGSAADAVGAGAAACGGRCARRETVLPCGDAAAVTLPWDDDMEYRCRDVLSHYTIYRRLYHIQACPAWRKEIADE